VGVRSGKDEEEEEGGTRSEVVGSLEDGLKPGMMGS